MGMTIDMDGVELIARYEGYRTNAYQCSAGVWTIGYGTTIYPNGKAVKKGDTCTKSEALAYMKNDLAKFEKVVNNSVSVPLTQNRFNALVSFAYNCGSLGKSMRAYINQERWLEAANQFDLFVNATANGQKKVILGLVKRRLAEKLIFFPGWVPKGNVNYLSSRTDILWSQQKMNEYAKTHRIKGWTFLVEDGLWGENTANGNNIIRSYLGWKPFTKFKSNKVTNKMITAISK